MYMNKSDGTYGNRAKNNGSITIKFTDGEITSSTISGSGYAGTVSSAGVAYRCDASNFQFTSITWTPD